MSKPRRKELWRRQRRKRKLTALRDAYRDGSERERKEILEKAFKAAPTISRDVLVKTFEQVAK